MISQLVLVEREDEKQNAIVGSSGIMLNGKYVIITANIVLNEDKEMCRKLKAGHLHTDLFSNYTTKFLVVWTEDKLYIVKPARIFSVFVSENVKNSSKYIFQNWAIDSIDNNRNLRDALSLFFVLTFDTPNNTNDLKDTLKEWWYLTENAKIEKTTKIYINSTPFGNRNFLNSFSEGIISNRLGENSCFLLSDCPCTPGSEGSPVYLVKGNALTLETPLGIVISSISWWKGEWVGLTLILDIRSIIMELVDVPRKEFSSIKNNYNEKIIATADLSLVQIYCGSNWGTAILFDEEDGIFITNSHVIENAEIKLFHKGKCWNAVLIYKTPENTGFDLAVIQSNKNIKEIGLKQIPVPTSEKNCKREDEIYSAGFSLFPKECQSSPTLTRGYISQIHKFMLKTTCCVHPGASGGAILNQEGQLLGIIVCNIKLHDNGVVYPRINMAIPFSAISDVFNKYIETKETNLLYSLAMNKEADAIWKRLEGKL